MCCWLLLLLPNYIHIFMTSKFMYVPLMRFVVQNAVVLVLVQFKNRVKEPNIWSSRMTRAIATALSMPGCTTSRNTSLPTASFGLISAATLLWVSYTVQHRCT